MLRAKLRAIPLVALGLLLGGCPLFQTPKLNATPKALSFGTTNSRQYINIQNTGTGMLNWSIEEVARANEDAPWQTQPSTFSSVDISSGSAQNEIDRVILSIDRAGLPVGTYTNLGLRISSNGGSEVIPYAFQIAPTLVVSPSNFNLAQNATSAEFTISNVGDSVADWEIQFVNNPASPLGWPLPDDFTVTPDAGTTAPGMETDVSLTWGPERTTDFQLLVHSVAGDSVLNFKFGSALEGLSIFPKPLKLFVGTETIGEEDTAPTEPSSTLHIGNTDAISHSWTIQLRNVGGGGTLPPIGITPTSGSTLAGEESEIDVRVTDRRKNLLLGSGHYELIVTSGGAFDIVPIQIEKRDLPVIGLSEPPDPNAARPEITALSLLDFERDKVQLEFWVANIGPRSSKLFFKVALQGETNPTKPLVVKVDPDSGDTNQGDPDFFYPPGSNTLIDAQKITVTIDRTALAEDLEYRTISVSAFEDETLTTPLDAVEPATVQMRVERQPLTIEGATNRARPPYLMRFVFLMRDEVGQAIPTRTADELAKTDYSIAENDAPLALDETNFFVEGPENLRVNLVLMLDYTGSLYNAGTDNPDAPLAKGEAIAQVRDAAIQFLDDLPPSYRVALMYHADRQQPNRLIANFSTDRAALKNALRNFTVPDTMHGVSDIRDAVYDAIERLAAEDSDETLPFDDADVRAVLFVTDGRDNSSVRAASDVQSKAQDTNTRLYPLVYSAGSQSDFADLITFAHETGGHLYNAGDVRNLAGLLGNAKGLSIEPTTRAGAPKGAFTITNNSLTGFRWTATIPSGTDWITGLNKTTEYLNPGESSEVTFNFNAPNIDLNSTRAVEIPITTNNDSGDGKVFVQASVGDVAGVISNVVLSVNDEPGIIWNELRNQVVLSYVTPSQTGGTYNVSARWERPDGGTIAGSFEKDGVFFSGDVRAGQLSLHTDGITEDFTQTDPTQQVRAEIYVRADYVPRDVTRFRLRFFLTLPEDAPVGASAALNDAEMDVALASDGLLSGDGNASAAWRLLTEADSSFILLTDESNALKYGAYGNLLKITISNLSAFRQVYAGLTASPTFLLGMRADNQIYVSPATPEQPSRTKFFLYPSCSTAPDRLLLVSDKPDLAPPAKFAQDLAVPNLDPEAPSAWDRDEDGLPDYDDPAPDDEALPGPLAVPTPTTLQPSESQRVFTVRNNGFNTFSWNLDSTDLEAWQTVDLSNSRFTLLPGEATTFTLNVDRTGQPDANYRQKLFLLSDTYPTEQIDVTIVVQTP